jgi:hypothetical protein
MGFEPHGWPGKVSRSGVIPGPTVKVRMKEDAPQVKLFQFLLERLAHGYSVSPETSFALNFAERFKHVYSYPNHPRVGCYRPVPGHHGT